MASIEPAFALSSAVCREFDERARRGRGLVGGTDDVPRSRERGARGVSVGGAAPGVRAGCGKRGKQYDAETKGSTKEHLSSLLIITGSTTVAVPWESSP